MSEDTSVVKAVRVLQTLTSNQQKLRRVERVFKSGAAAHERIDAQILTRIGEIMMDGPDAASATDPTNGIQLDMETSVPTPN